MYDPNPNDCDVTVDAGSLPPDTPAMAHTTNDGYGSGWTVNETFLSQVDPSYDSWWSYLGGHELGHVYGFDNVHTSGCPGYTIMFWLMNPPLPASLKCSDQQNANSYYPDEPLPCDTDPGWPGCNSPLVIDTKGNGFRFTSAKHGVMFDIDADGVLERVGWTQGNSDDMWLAMDRNGNGVIDNGSELFGDVTPVDPANPAATALNGFEALKALDSVPDGVIDRHDAAFAQLILWSDQNHDGVSTLDELEPVPVSRLEAVELTYRIVSRVRRGNTIRQASWVTWAGRKRAIVDVWLDTMER